MNEDVDMGSHVLDELDRAVVHLLHVDPRVSFGHLGEALGCSEQTVARRYRRMVSHGILRIVTLVNPSAFGLTASLIRIKARPDSAKALAQALAAREDAMWVAIADGGTEIAGLIQAHSVRSRDELLLERLPRTSHVLSLTVQVILHAFSSADGVGWTERSPLVTLEMEQALKSMRPTPTDSHVRRPLGAEDDALMEALALDGRTSIADLGLVTGWTPAKTARRVSQLFDSGTIYLDVDVAAGNRQLVYFWLIVEPALLAEVGQTLVNLVPVAFAGATTGVANLLVVGEFPDMESCYVFLTEQLGHVRGIRQAEVSAVHRRVKYAKSWVDGQRLSSFPVTPPRDNATQPPPPRPVRT